MTVQPMAFAIRTAAVPMPEPAAWTRMVSPGSSPALSNSMCCTVAKVMPVQAASSTATPSGTGTSSRAGRFSRSCAKPGRWKPRMPAMFSHKLSRPSRQARHTPQVMPP